VTANNREGSRWNDRRESLKAGAIAGATFASAVVLWRLGQDSLQLRAWLALPEPGLDGAIALLTGAVFGLAYRYIRREDRNPHLDSGAVTAFAIARASGSWEAGGWALAIAAGESAFGFWLASLALNLALQRQWVQCCPPRAEPHA